MWATLSLLSVARTSGCMIGSCWSFGGDTGGTGLWTYSDSEEFRGEMVLGRNDPEPFSSAFPVLLRKRAM